MRFVSRFTLPLVFFALTALVTGEVCARNLNVPGDYNTIKEALQSSLDGDVINISPGYYYENNLEMRHAVTLNGTGSGPDAVVIDGSQQAQVLLCESIVTGSTIQNITFTHGNAIGEAIYDKSGGAIHFSNCSPRIINCNFFGNTAGASGGAIRCTNASPQIINCAFIDNSAADGGGAIDCSYDSSPLIRECLFKNNEARWGGGLSCRGNASPYIVGTVFDRNTSSGENMGFGGAIFADYQAEPDFLKCTFYGNEGKYGGAVACFQSSITNLDHCTLVENKAHWIGGGMFCMDASPLIKSSIFAFHDGTAISASGVAVPQIELTDIYGNSRGDWVGAIADQEEQNFSVDPLFCDFDPDLLFRFNLTDKSPLGEEFQENGTLGAWPVGCTVVANALDFDAIWSNQHPNITWALDANDEPMIFRLTRSVPQHEENEAEIPFNILDDNTFEAVDTVVSPVRGWQYLYRLYMLDAREGWILLEEITLDSDVSGKAGINIHAFPNPFNPSTTIQFEVDRPQHVRVAIYDLRGNRITVLEDRVLEPGSKNIPWNGSNDHGMRVASGTYFVVIQTDSATRSKKIMMIE